LCRIVDLVVLIRDSRGLKKNRRAV
jgi:hypothetical protein